MLVQESPHNDVLNVFIDLVCALVNLSRILTDCLRVLVDFFGISTHSDCVLINLSGIPTNFLRGLANALGVFADLLCVLVGVLL